MRSKNHKNKITIVDDENRVVGSMARKKALKKGLNYRTVHVLATLNGKLVLQHLSEEHIRSPGKVGSSAAGFVLANEKREQAARRVLQKELGVDDASLLHVGTISLNDEKSVKFVTCYSAELNTLPEENPSEFSQLSCFSVDELDAQVETTPGAFADTFLAVFEIWKSNEINRKELQLMPNSENYSESDCHALLDAYKCAVDEYRFQVESAWDRSRFFLVSGLASISAAIAMMEFVGHAITEFLIPSLFALAGGLGLLGIAAQRIGKLYYRRSLDHLVSVTKLLNKENARRNPNFVAIPLFNITPGMISRETGDPDVDRTGRINRGSFLSYVRIFFVLIAVVGFGGAVSSFYNIVITSGILSPLIQTVVDVFSANS